MTPHNTQAKRSVESESYVETECGISNSNSLRCNVVTWNMNKLSNTIGIDFRNVTKLYEPLHFELNILLGSQRVRHDLSTWQQQQKLLHNTGKEKNP